MIELKNIDEEILHELEPAIASLHDRHMEASRSWEPHKLVPWSEGRDFTDNDDWSPDDYPLPDSVRSSIYVNLLTEDNLPYYTELLRKRSEGSEALRAWVGQWTAEEGRHAEVIRSWVHTTRAINPSELESSRMIQMSTGITPQPPTLAEALIYTSLQELATNVAHRNTGRKLGREHAASKVMAMVAGDEMNHHRFYRDVAKSGFDIDPSQFVVAAYKQIKHFAMPGTGIPDFEKHAEAISMAGIYGINEYKTDVLEKTLDAWDFWKIEGLSDEAEKARDRIDRRLSALGRAATHEAEARESLANQATSK